MLARLAKTFAVAGDAGALGMVGYGPASQVSRWFAALAEDTYNVPLGHKNSRLDSVTCNISLGRRRDLTLRQDIRVFGATGEMSLGDLFKGRKTVLLGLPGGQVCEDKHLPDYLRNFPKLKGMGIDKVVVMKQNTPEAVQEFASRVGADPEVVEVVADPKGAFTRLLGVEILEGPVKHHRYTGLVDNGILLKLNVEEKPKDYSKCSVDKTAKVIQTLLHSK